MATIMENNTVTFSAVVYEDEIVPLRDFLQMASPSEITVDFTACDDIHLGVLQLILGYKKLYGASFVYGSDMKLYQKVCEGFETSEIHCA
ncbi:MAG TPA: hypothetical protein VFX66_02545 [Sulfuricurvum sp.]|nr:hypothetical protein [Sulfuricurvum sp.]